MPNSMYVVVALEHTSNPTLSQSPLFLSPRCYRRDPGLPAHQPTDAMSYSYYVPNTRSWAYQQNCALKPIPSTALGAAIFSALDVFQGVPARVALSPRAVGELCCDVI